MPKFLKRTGADAEEFMILDVFHQFHSVARLAEALCYRQEGREIESMMR
jgi:hypothetical protein